MPIPATLFSVSLNRFFSLQPLFFNAIFPFGMFSFILTQLLLTLLIMHLDHYIFSALVRSFILEKGFQELLICILGCTLDTLTNNTQQYTRTNCTNLQR